ncbi:MAG: hypothetical protein KKF65_00090 [Nanoarchaeota archaeon]|nr:hypothetical protein [Nanoarchaeota archaeon]
MKKLLLLLIITILVLLGCRSLNINNIPAACSSRYDFDNSKISNKELIPVQNYIAKKGNYLFFSETYGLNKGQTEIRIDITQRKITKNTYQKGNKETETYNKEDQRYEPTIEYVTNLTEKYLEEANIIEGYDKGHDLKVEKYQACLKKLR